MSNTNESISAKLRRWADESDMEHSYPSIIAGRELGFGDCVTTKEERALFHHIADEIDREKREITERYARQSWMNPADAIAKLATGEIEWSEIKEAIDRYYLPRPLFEDGEPVEVGDSVELNGYTREVTGLHVSCDGKVTMNVKDGSSFTFDREIPLFKRPKQPVLDADGVPIGVGDTVWNVFDDQKRTVIGLRGGKAHVESGPGIEFFEAGHELTHREPDTQERIDRDALKGEYEYWGCTGSECHNCPALVDGKKPNQRYGILWCGCATRLDLLRRQRELDGRDA